jgi:hypothetical protein
MLSEIQRWKEGLDLLLVALGTALRGEVRCTLGKERRRGSVGMGMLTNSVLVHKSNSCLVAEESFYFLRIGSFQEMNPLMKKKMTVIHEMNQDLQVFLAQAFLL